ncbi:hypothetical protein NF865_02290 [Thermococcus aggregans]|uniref:Uncharacterized protein n=1 Tax=Thermococcus aggregans TaxID=110163 RepID=A0A9E7SPM6_THEAG|nr:hypothetical protein [Thermococcus aggregans]USS41067.1 hypothetical protein NF865_02290 [Thermococcus aggregans]
MRASFGSKPYFLEISVERSVISEVISRKFGMLNIGKRDFRNSSAVSLTDALFFFSSQ